MTIELIRQAIERLGHLKGESLPGPWILDDSWDTPTVRSATTGYAVVKPLNNIDAEIVVTMRRTLDVQLEILECGLDPHADIMVVEHAESLAKAIMGVE